MKHTPATVYPEGHFTALVREHNWPPMFVSRFDHRSGDFNRQAAAAAVAREKAAIKGGGWGTGTISLPNTPTNRAPGMMERTA